MTSHMINLSVFSNHLVLLSCGNRLSVLKSMIITVLHGSFRKSFIDITNYMKRSQETKKSCFMSS